MHRERGVIAVVVALSATALLGATALAVDVAGLARRRQVLQNAVDFGALAGAAHLPVRDAAGAAVADADARRFTAENAAGLEPGRVAVSFLCTLDDADRDGAPDAAGPAAACGPATGTWPDGWSGRDGRVHHACVPAVGDTCNAIDVTADDVVPFTFATVLGHDGASTGTVRSTACGAACGRGGPRDVVLVFDRSDSLTDRDLRRAKDALLEMLAAYDARRHHVGLVAIPFGRAGNACVPDRFPVFPGSTDVWRAAAISDDYQRGDGTLDRGSALVATIDCLQKNRGNYGLGRTDLGDALAAARDMLATEGRPDVPDTIVLFGDGAANQPRTAPPCALAAEVADGGKALGLEVFSVGYGVTGERCADDHVGRFAGAPSTALLAALATDSTDDHPSRCGPNENTDGDHYFCQPVGGDLASVFRSIAKASAGGAFLVDVR